MDPETWNKVLAVARQEGDIAGRNAAGWFAQDAFGGRVTRGERVAAKRIIAGIENGDPEVFDALPVPDLSGEWAGQPAGPAVVTHILNVAGVEAETGDLSTDILDAWESAHNDAVSDEVVRLARLSL